MGWLEKIKLKIAKAAEEAGKRSVVSIRNEISERYPPASEPETPPHLRTGKLYDGIASQVNEFHDGITLTVSSEMYYSAWLRDGTTKMQWRDFFREHTEEVVNDFVLEELEFELNPQSPSLSADTNLEELFGIELEP